MESISNSFAETLANNISSCHMNYTHIFGGQHADERCTHISRTRPIIYTFITSEKRRSVRVARRKFPSRSLRALPPPPPREHLSQRHRRRGPRKLSQRARRGESVMACGNLRKLTARAGRTDAHRPGVTCAACVRARVRVPSLAGRPRRAVPGEARNIVFNLQTIQLASVTVSNNEGDEPLSVHPLPSSSSSSSPTTSFTAHTTPYRPPYPAPAFSAFRPAASPPPPWDTEVNFIRVKLCNDLKGPPPSCLYCVRVYIHIR